MAPEEAQLDVAGSDASDDDGPLEEPLAQPPSLPAPAPRTHAWWSSKRRGLTTRRHYAAAFQTLDARQPDARSRADFVPQTVCKGDEKVHTESTFAAGRESNLHCCQLDSELGPDASLAKCVANDVLIARYGASVGRILRGLTGAYNVALAKVQPKASDLRRALRAS